MKLKLVLLASIFALGFAFTANAGSVTDTDGDLVPDQFDNCLSDANGPNQGSNQIDTDADGFLTYDETSNLLRKLQELGSFVENSASFVDTSKCSLYPTRASRPTRPRERFLCTERRA